MAIWCKSTRAAIEPGCVKFWTVRCTLEEVERAKAQGWLIHVQSRSGRIQCVKLRRRMYQEEGGEVLYEVEVVQKEQSRNFFREKNAERRRKARAQAEREVEEINQPKEETT